MRRRDGFTLLEVLVALVVLAVGIVALERLLARSVAGVAVDAELTRAMLAARALLAEAEVRPPEPGTTTGTRGGLTFERWVGRTAAPGLREVRVRVFVAGGATCELVELVHVPAA